MAAAERITFADFQKRFKAEEACRGYLYRQRFPQGFGCPPIWYMLKRIRSAMGQRDANYLLSGLLEMDEGYWGSRKSGKRGRGTSQKKVVVALSKTIFKTVLRLNVMTSNPIWI